jgi:Rrf2 family protein
MNRIRPDQSNELLQSFSISGYNNLDIQMLSQTVEYSLRAVVWLATHIEDPQTTQQIAAATLVPAGYLAKVMQSLGRGGLVTAQRGKHGGFVLAKPAEAVSVLEVINTVEPIQRIRECPLGIAVHGSHLCPLHKRLDAAMSMIEEAFRSTSIADVLAEPSKSKPLCRIEGVQNAA